MISSHSLPRSNLVEGIDNQYIKSCVYDPTTSPLCPIFRLGDLVQLSGFNFATIAKVVSNNNILFMSEAGLQAPVNPWVGCVFGVGDHSVGIYC